MFRVIRDSVTEYAREVWRVSWALLLGVGFTIVGALREVGLLPASMQFPAWMWWAFAFLCIACAQFLAFHKVRSERDYARRQVEELERSPRSDKARAILRRKGSVVRIIARKVLGSRTPIRDPMYAERVEGVIENCSDQVLTLRVPSRGTTYQEPLEKVRILADASDQPMELEINE